MEISEKTHTLSGLLKTYCSKQLQKASFPSPADLANQDWAASHFVARLLKNAKLPSSPTIKSFEEFRDKYYEETGYSIDTQSLLDRHWVRIWGGEIKIAQQIRHQFMYLRNYEKDLPKPAFWGKYKFDFQFLESFAEKFSNEEAQATIPKLILLELIEKHRNVFPKTPDVDGLLSLGWFSQKSENEFTIHFNTAVYDHDFVNDVAAIVWNDLLEENKTHDEIELLKQWENLTWKNGFYPFGFLKKLPYPSRQKFEDAICQLLENEQDLLQPESEILKGRLDFYMNDRGNFNPDAMPDFPLKNFGGFNGFDEVRCWDWVLHIFDYQPVRSNLRTYLREILNIERASTTETWREEHLKMAKRLLEISQQRPALLYTFCKLVQDDFPEIIPVFFKSIENLSLGCYLTQYAPIRPEVLPENHRERYLPEQETRSLLFQAAFEIVLGKLAVQRDATLAGKVVCEVLLMPAKWMYHEKGDEKFGFSVANELNQRYQNAWATIGSNKISSEIWFLNTPAALTRFANGFTEHLEQPWIPPVRNSQKSLNLPFLSLLSSLFQLVQSQQNLFPSDSSIAGLGQKIRQSFIQNYCQDFKAIKIEVLNFSANRLVSGDVSWHFEPDNLDFVNFEPLFEANRTEIGNLLDAVRPQDFQQVPDEGIERDIANEEENDARLLNHEGKMRNEKVKFRTHFRFILRFYRALANDRVKHKIGFSKWESMEAQIRQKMLDWVGFNRNDASAGLYDIYDVHLDNSHAPFSELPPLVQDIVQTINLFPNEKSRLEFVEHMTDGLARLDLLLKIHNTAFDIPCKMHVQKVVSNIDLQSFTGSQFLWKPIETALIEATNDGAFLEIAERLLSFVKEKSTLKKSYFGFQYSQFLLEIQLILAYRNNDRSQMDFAIGEYELETGNPDADYLAGRVKFFNGIFLMLENRLEEAAALWKELSKTDVSVDVHYRKLYCETQSALEVNDGQLRNQRILNAYEDWENYAARDGSKEDTSKFWDGILYCKMAWLNVKAEDAEFDFCKSQLSYYSLFDVEVLRLILENYGRRGLDEQAGRLFMEAREYFARYDPSKIEPLEALRGLVNWEPTWASLKKVLGSLSGASVSDLIKTVPDAFNPYSTIPEFLLYEFQFVAQELLDKITSVKSIKGENQYSDLFTVLLRMRLSFLRFEVGDQPREGKSPSRKDAGEIDMTIRYASKKIASYEASIFRDKKRTQEHLTKVFDYNPTGNLFFSVVFFKGKNPIFEAKFKNYQRILKSTPFPERHKIQGGFEGIPEFTSRPNLLLGTTLHGEARAVMFHLFVNLAYGEE